MEKQKKIKVLHLASFLGNIGDYANHQGFYKNFTKIIPAKFSQIEIRKFYQNRREMKFDDNFLKLVNSHDLFVIGGGGFFDLNWDYSSTGTTLDFTKEFVNKIKIPVLVNAIGYHEFNIVKKENIEKFGKFLGLITDKNNWFVSVRNDGSLKRIRLRYGKLADKILKVPDNGFYYRPNKFDRLNLEKNNIKWIGMNITNDLFSKKYNGKIDTTFFNYEISSFIDKVLNEHNKARIILFPHAHQDIAVIGKILSNIQDKYKRERIIIAPLVTAESSIDNVFDLYQICSCVIGMRFHTNVCSIAMNIPTIGLAGHEQIHCLYEEIGLPDHCIRVNNKKFASKLYKKLKNLLKNHKKIKKSYNKINTRLDIESRLYFENIFKWFSRENKKNFY